MRPLADECRGTRPVVCKHVRLEPPHDHRRLAGRLGAREVGGARDLVGDGKWRDYLDYCDRFFWAVPESLCAILEQEHFLPGEAGLLVADRYDAVILREALDRPLAPARRKAETLRFARRAARRLSAQIDPTLGEGS